MHIPGGIVGIRWYMVLGDNNTKYLCIYHVVLVVLGGIWYLIITLNIYTYTMWY